MSKDVPDTRLQIFSIYDKVAESYMPPFFMPNTGSAIRAFCDEINRSGSNLAAHPHDVDLYHIGGFCDTYCDLIPFKKPRLLLSGFNALRTLTADNDLP